MKSSTPSDQSQHARFVETARKLGCDESEEAFDEKLKAIARHKSKAKPPAELEPDEGAKPPATR
ncbi:MAG: hypothetical protein JO326_14855 [Acetobacteraceae bacterium]|nr:hypothetical protein [Acetobacteraceae bacterium]